MTFRVIVLEPDGRRTESEFESRDEAIRYADDAASEDGGPLARVYDENMEIVHEGRPFFA